jgi:hypothetical protein
MNRFTVALAAALAIVGVAAQAQADPSEYAIESASATASTTQAGGHPDFEIALRLKTEPGGEDLPSTTQDLYFKLPPGLLGNPNAVPKCTAAQLMGTDPEDPSSGTGCPQASQVGIAEVELFKDGLLLAAIFEPIFNMEPGYGEPARLGFFAYLLPVFISTELRPDRGYAATAKVEGASSLIPLLSANSTLWGAPADESHDGQRITAYEAVHTGGAPDTPNGKRSSGLVPVPFMLNPVRCGLSQGIDITAIPYALPDLEAKAFAPLQPNSGCGALEFEPSMSIDATTSQADTGSGLDVDLSFPTDGLENPNVYVGAEQKRAEVTLPEGVTVNPSQAVGLGVCTEADLARETFSSGPGEGCSEAAKIGSATARSPLLEESAEGAVYIAEPGKNPFGLLIAIYLVLKIPERGVIVKLAGKVEPDPVTGQLVTTFDDIPQLPVESFHLHFREGARAPLVTPSRCGTYTSTAHFISWDGQTATTHPTFQISSGVNGGPCPQGTPPFEPGFTAKTRNLKAGSYSPFYMRLTRRDGDQDLTRFSSKLPPGLVAKLAGVTECPDTAIAAAKAKAGVEELASPSCPATSEVGNVLAGAGVGQVLTYATGKLYLAGPFQGAPLSVAAIVPAVAGPFDVGTVVTRVPLRIDPESAEVEADGAASDPIPRILAGIPLKVRDIRVYVDRPDFALNPTSCKEMTVLASIWGDSPVSLSDRFQVANCSPLGFKPRLRLRLKGGTRRAAHPALTAILRARPGDANIGRAQVALPRSEFLDQGHIRTVCTRVQFAADQCPKGSIYGHATATTPLLDQPLKGPVYLRSSNNLLPDLVIALKGQVEINAVGRIDSIKGGIRTTFATVPDAPITKFVLTMQGGKKGLLINSRNLCKATSRATVELDAHNGKSADQHPILQNDCASKARKPSRKP